MPLGRKINTKPGTQRGIHRVKGVRTGSGRKLLMEKYTEQAAWGQNTNGFESMWFRIHSVGNEE